VFMAASSLTAGLAPTSEASWPQAHWPGLHGPIPFGNLSVLRPRPVCSSSRPMIAHERWETIRMSGVPATVEATGDKLAG